MKESLFYTTMARFDAARRIDSLPQGHRQGRVHGHGFVVQVRARPPIAGSVPPGTEVAHLGRLSHECVAPLDHRFLNDLVTDPTDERLARWIRDHLDWPGIDMVGLQSTWNAGVSLDGRLHAHPWRLFSFEAAHRLPHVPPGHPCGRMHGHGFRVIIHVDGNASTQMTPFDPDDIDRHWHPLQRQLHAHCLNEIPGLENPTSEMLAGWIWQRLEGRLPERFRVTVLETASSGTSFDGQHHRIWKEFTLDSAVRLARVSREDPLHRLHGHTFTLRLHLSASLDAILGWTVDFGDVKRLFLPVFSLLDHHPLHELNGLEDNDCLSLARWIHSQTAPLLPQLDRIDLLETPGCGVILATQDAAKPLFP
ncbi:MAG: 6-carboxytetrahydropterin synthase [Magnetococcales bacterium]|nr:6-carboxytetrahydropterin synthase [Magnetococcales bacterium]